MKDFDVVKKIGQGSYGTVYKVKRKRDGHVLVIKQIEMGKATKKDQREAENEVQILKSLKHRYVVRYIDSFVENKKLNIVMEYCSGGDLGKLLKLSHGGLEEKKVWRYLLQMLLGLRYIHTRKVLHRDMKTINVFLTDTDEVRIGDLGVAKIAQDQSMFAQTIVGTPYYLSPELCEERPYNEKSDVWALGCIVYEMCTKNHPFKATNQGALALKIIKGMYQPIPSTYSADLSHAIGFMLTKDYWKRPTTGQLLGMTIFDSKLRELGIQDDPQPSSVGIDNFLNWTNKGDEPQQSKNTTAKNPEKKLDHARKSTQGVSKDNRPQKSEKQGEEGSALDLPPRPALFSSSKPVNNVPASPAQGKAGAGKDQANIFNKADNRNIGKKIGVNEKVITVAHNPAAESRTGQTGKHQTGKDSVDKKTEGRSDDAGGRVSSLREPEKKEHKTYSEQRALFKPIVQTEAALLMHNRPKEDIKVLSPIKPSQLPSIAQPPSQLRKSLADKDNSVVGSRDSKVQVVKPRTDRLSSAKPAIFQRKPPDQAKLQVHNQDKLTELQKPNRGPSALAKPPAQKGPSAINGPRKASAVKPLSFNMSARKDGGKLREREREIQMVLDLPDDSSSSDSKADIELVTRQTGQERVAAEKEKRADPRFTVETKDEVVCKPSKAAAGFKGESKGGRSRDAGVDKCQEVEMFEKGSPIKGKLADRDDTYHSKTDLDDHIFFEVAEKEVGAKKLPPLNLHNPISKRNNPSFVLKSSENSPNMQHSKLDVNQMSADRRLKPGIKSVLASPMDQSPLNQKSDSLQAFPFDMEYDDIDQEAIA